MEVHCGHGACRKEAHAMPATARPCCLTYLFIYLNLVAGLKPMNTIVSKGVSRVKIDDMFILEENTKGTSGHSLKL